jgi:diaminopimelate epimerase
MKTVEFSSIDFGNIHFVLFINFQANRSNLNSLNTFIKETSSPNECETGSNKVKLLKVGSNAIVPRPCGGRAQ